MSRTNLQIETNLKMHHSSSRQDGCGLGRLASIAFGLELEMVDDNIELDHIRNLKLLPGWEKIAAGILKTITGDYDWWPDLVQIASDSTNKNPEVTLQSVDSLNYRIMHNEDNIVRCMGKRQKSPLMTEIGDAVAETVIIDTAVRERNQRGTNFFAYKGEAHGIETKEWLTYPGGRQIQDVVYLARQNQYMSLLTKIAGFDLILGDTWGSPHRRANTLEVLFLLLLCDSYKNPTSPAKVVMIALSTTLLYIAAEKSLTVVKNIYEFRFGDVIEETPAIEYDGCVLLHRVEPHLYRQRPRMAQHQNFGNPTAAASSSQCQSGNTTHQNEGPAVELTRCMRRIVEGVSSPKFNMDQIPMELKPHFKAIAQTIYLTQAFGGAQSLGAPSKKMRTGSPSQEQMIMLMEAVARIINQNQVS